MRNRGDLARPVSTEHQCAQQGVTHVAPREKMKGEHQDTLEGETVVPHRARQNSEWEAPPDAWRPHEKSDNLMESDMRSQGDWLSESRQCRRASGVLVLNPWNKCLRHMFPLCYVRHTLWSSLVTNTYNKEISNSAPPLRRWWCRGRRARCTSNSPRK